MQQLKDIIKFLRQQDELEAAANLLDVFQKYAANLEQYDVLGNCYSEIKYYKKAIEVAEKCLTMVSSNESLYAARANLAKMHNHINDPQTALRYIKANELIDPNDFDTAMEKVFAYYSLGKKDMSEAILREQIKRTDLDEKQMNRILFNCGTYDLKHGEFQKALKEFYVIGKKIEIWPSPQLSGKFWEGGYRPGETLVIFAEGGIGDEIISARFCKQIESLGMNTIWLTHRKFLKDILERAGVGKVATHVNQLPKDFYWTYSMSLPIYMDLTTKDLWKGQYIFPKQEYVDKFSWIKKSSDKPKVGIRWSGNPRYEQDLHRTINLHELYDVIKDRGYELYSIQKDNDLEVLKNFPDIIDMSKHMETFEDTLGVIENLDFVISSCTSVAHAAAAMNKKTYVMVPIAAYYTWESTSDETSPWYSNVTLCRQTEHKSWTKPLSELKEFLDKND
jgi:hypothetical protein